MRFISKPVVIEAIQLTPETIEDVYDFMGITNKGNFPGCGHGLDPADGQFKVTTTEGVMRANITDWIIKGTEGEFYPCKDSVFKRKYELSNELEYEGFKVGQTVRFLNAHPLSGHLGKITGFQKIPEGLRPLVKLIDVPDQTCFITEPDDAKILE